MINILIRWSLQNRLAICVLSLIVMGVGAYATWRMPVDVFPDLTAPTVTILVEGRGMSPLEMETLVTYPIETAMNGAPDVRRVRSGTAVGIAVIWVEFDWGADIYRARQTVTERLSAISGSLPSQIEPPKLAPISSIMGEILFISLTSPRHSSMDLHTVAVSQVRRRLLSVAGVSQVTPIGGDTKQFQVILAPEKLRAYGIAATDVITALESTNENVSAGVLVAGAEEFLVEGIGRVRTMEDIGSTVVTTRADVPVSVSDLGVVTVGAAFKRGTASASYRDPQWAPKIEPGVIIAIQKQPGANTLELTSRLDGTLDDIQKSLPDGVQINKNLFRQAAFIENSIVNTTTALLEGAAMVALIVVAFLMSISASMITLLVLPISLCAAILALEWFGSSINTMTLGGMAIAIGAMVDDAIIDVENVVRRLRENEAAPLEHRRSILEVIYSASVEVRASIVIATLIVLLVFAPLFFLSGVEGRLLRPLGMAFCIALAASLFTALTVTPALCYLFLPSSKTVRSAREPWLVRICKQLYVRPLRWALNHPWMVTLPSIAALIIAVIGSTRLGRNFLPEFNEGALVVGLVTVPGTSLAESDRLAHLVEEALMKHPEIAAIGRRTGRAEEDEHVQGVEASEIDLTLDMEAPKRLGKPSRSKEELLQALRQDLAMVPGVHATFGQPISHRIDHMLSGTRASIAVKIFGEKLEVLRDLAAQVESAMSRVPGIVDLSMEQQSLVPTLRVEFDRTELARHGLRVADAANALATATQGHVVSQVVDGMNSFDLAVRVGDVQSLSTDVLAETLVATPHGARIPLRVVATLREDRTPNFISRENVQRKMVVTCNVADRDIRSVVDGIRETVTKNVVLPNGYYVEYGGQFESAEATGRLLTILGGAVILGIAALLYFMFRSFRDTALIMVNLPLALVGGVIGVYLTGATLSVASIIGFITVFGVAARNGIMMISHIRHLQEHEGVTDFREAVTRGALERLSPILMTALAAGLALVPLALRGDRPGNEILTPMAVVILFGLLSSTLLNMVLVPTLYLHLGRPINAGAQNV